MTVVCPAVGLACHHGNLGDRRLAVRVDDLGTVLDDTAVLLVDARQKPGHIDEGDQGNIECITRTHEPGTLQRCGDVETPGQGPGLIRDDTDRVPVEVPEPHNHVHCIVLLDFEKRVIVQDTFDNLLHVIGSPGVCGNHVVQGLVGSIRVVGTLHDGGLLPVVLREVLGEAPLPCRGHPGRILPQSGRPRSWCCGSWAPPRASAVTSSGGHSRLDDLGPGDEHVAGFLDHDDEIGDRGRVDRAPPHTAP